MDNTAKQVKIINPTKRIENLIRVAAYCRVSSDSTDQINSFFAQVRYYTDYIRCNDRMALVDIYADEGITGTAVEKRDEFKRMLKDARNRKIDRILVKSVTRFARNSLECLESIRALKSYGTSVYFENDHIDTAIMNSEMILYIKSAFAQNEAMSASRRMALSNRMRMEEGTYKNASTPYGYRQVDGAWIIEESEAANVREIFRLYLTGKGENVIARMMNERPENGRDWKVSHIKYILTNEKYIGDTLYQKRYTPSVLPLGQKKNKGELPQYYIENSHEAIIPRDVFEKVKKLRQQHGEKFYTAPTSVLFYCRQNICGNGRRFDLSFEMRTRIKGICAEVVMAHRMINYGYGIENGTIIVLPNEAEVVKGIFDSYSRGENLKKIAADLTERNVVFFENRSVWSKAVVMRIIENKRYIGNDGYPAIIDVDLFEKINRAKNEKSHKKGEQPEIISYLKTVMFCGECGKQMRRMRDWGTNEKWHCSGGCRCKKYVDDNFILCGIKRILSAVCDNPILLNKSTETPTYTKTQEILRYTNEIGRYTNERAPSFKTGKKLILECAALKFSACTYNANDTIAACIAEQLSREQEYLSKEFLQKIIERIFIHKNGMMTIRFIGGIEVSESDLEEQYGSAS